MRLCNYSIFDAHCDTLYKLQNENGTEELQFQLSSAQNFAQYLQVMAIWIDKARIQDCFSYAMQGIETFNAYKGKNTVIRNKNDLAVHKHGVGLLLAIEGGDALCGKIENVKTFFDKGVRLLTLTWNGANELSDSAMENKNPGGLTTFGKRVLSEMEKYGMAADVSHISEKGFWDVLEYAKKPIIASHSCSKNVFSNPRNLTNEQFAGIKENGGMVGVNFYPAFLGGNSLYDILRHILHFLSLGGENNIGFGSDFDGVDSLPKEIRSSADMYKIIDKLLQENISETIVKKIAYDNMRNYFLRILPN